MWIGPHRRCGELRAFTTPWNRPDDELPSGRRRHRGAHSGQRYVKRTSVATLGLAAVVTGWTYATPGESPGPFKLYTHCGVRERNNNGTWHVREGGPLASEAGTPKGWDDPYQRLGHHRRQPCHVPGQLGPHGDLRRASRSHETPRRLFVTRVRHDASLCPHLAPDLDSTRGLHRALDEALLA